MFWRFFSDRPRRQSFSKRATGPARRGSRALRFESLETRQMLSVSLGSLNNIQIPGGQSVLVPLTGVDSGGGPITYTFGSSDPNVTLALVSPTSQSLEMNVSGTDANNQAFSGTLVFHLFEDLTPITTARIEQLVGQNFYTGQQFIRVIDGFVAQNGGSTGQSFASEIVPTLNFNSPGLLAMANAGPNTNDAQMFITAIDGAGSTNPISLARMPQSLDGSYTIFGQLVSGFDTFEDIMSTPVVANSAFNGEVSQPVNTITINSAQIIDDTQDAVLSVSAPASFDGSSATITVTATNAADETAAQTFTAAAVVDPPFLQPVSDQTTTTTTPVNFTLQSTQNDTTVGVAYTVVDATTFQPPANVTVSIDQSTGQVTLTAAAGFTGTVHLLAGVRASSAPDVQSSYDTLPFTLTVGAPPAAPTSLSVDSASETGTFTGNGYITTDTPTLDVAAETGATVQFMLGGTVIGTGTETTAGSGQYTGALAADKLAVGTNSVTAVVTDSFGTSVASTPLTLIYAPDYTAGEYVVPGAAGTTVQLTIDWTSVNAFFKNEIGYFVADSLDGTVGGVAPGSAGYAQAALGSSTRNVIFAQGKTAGATDTITVQGGQVLVFYLIQDSTTANFLAKNPSDSSQGPNPTAHPLAFFSVQAANPDGMNHTQVIADPTTGRGEYNWEDELSLGDSDFNDLVMTVGVAAQPTTPPAVLHAPGTGETTVTLNGTLGAAHETTPAGDVGAYFVDNPNGAIGTLNPGDSGYAAAALAAGNTPLLFAAGAASGAQQSITVPAGQYLAFYLITSGTTANFLTANPTNSLTGGPVALFSFDAANPDQVNHFRWYTPGTTATQPGVTQLHLMGTLSGGESDFDDLTINLNFSA